MPGWDRGLVNVPRAARGTRKVAATLAVLAAWGCEGDPAPPARDGFTRVTLESDPGDYIGQGDTYGYTQADSRIVVNDVNGGLSVTVEGDEDWTGAFPSTQGRSRVEVGQVAGVSLNWEGDHRACGATNGWYVVDEVTYTDGLFTDVVFRFEQFCSGQGTGPSLRGEVRWSAFDSTVPPGPEFPVPASVWRPDPGSIPDQGDYLYLESDPNDYIGQGVEWFYSMEVDPVEVESSGGLVAFLLDHDDRWNAQFEAMNVVERIEPGYYPELQRWGFSNPYRGGFSITGGSRGCNESRSWVAVDDVQYVDGAVASISMRFEQFCDGNADAVRGAFRWGS